MSKPIVIALGEILWDMLPTGKRAGGAPVNFAYHASQNGAESYAISAVGNDELGAELLNDAHKAGINTLVQTNEYPTGTVAVALTNGIPEYTIVQNVAWDHIGYTDELAEAVSKADAICFGTLGLRSQESHDTIIKLLQHAKEGALKFFDINLRANFYSKELIEELLGYANIFKINDDELIMMREMFSIPEGNDEEACKWFMDRFDLEYTILTGGATFSTIIAKDGETSTLLTPHVEVADTVGAGDSFSGSFTGKILSGASLKEAHRAAVNTKNLSSLDLISLNTSKKSTNVITWFCFIKELSEHFDTSYNNLTDVFVDTNDFNFLVNLKDTSFYSTSINCTTAMPVG